MEGAAQTILVNVGQLAGQEFWQLRAVGGEIAELKEELATMNTLLRMQSEANESGLSHFVREWMKQLRELAYDAEDCVDLYLFRIRSRTGDGFVVWSKTKRLFATLFLRHRLAGDIKALRLRAVSISERHARYVVSLDLLGGAASSTPAPLEAEAASPSALHPSNKDPNQLVGIKAQAEQLANKVKAGEGERLKVFSIVGFGGLGKTTLAMEVCRLLETEFPRQAKVSASQTFGSQDIEGLLKRLLRQIMQFQSEPVASQQSEQASEGVGLQCEETTEPDRKRAAEAAAKLVELLGKIDRMNLGELQGMLEKSLQNNRYLLLIDDVWSKVAWNAIWSMLPSNNYGSRIIVTTRIDSVAKACSTAGDDYIHHMKALEEKESIQLFQSKAFGSMTEDSCPNDLKDAMKKILKKCGGLPLAIVSIAKLLASYTHPEGKKMWEIVGRSIGSQMESNPTLKGMRQILTLSYDHLPYHLKGCMMYLSIFPEDYVISKDRLLKRWIAEGLIPKKRGMTQMEVAEDYFNELLSRSMIDRGTDIVTMYHWREETCRVHDIMLEVLVSKSLEFNFVSLIGGQYEGMSYDRIRRLTIHGGEAPQDSSPKRMAVYRGTRNDIKEMTLQHVRSLSIFDPEAHMLLARLGDFTLLRVLDLEDCKGLEEKHMRHICQMYLLRFLSLKGTDIKVMPSRIGDLEHLQTLDVRQTQLKCLPSRIGDLKHLQTLDVRQTQLESLPGTVTRLEKLENLLFSTEGNNWSGWTLPGGIGKMKALRHVNKAAVIHPNVAKEIGELDQLQELCIYVDTSEGQVDENIFKELACSLSKIYSLQWLEIGNFACYKWPFKQALQFLHDVEQPPQLLRYLRICGCLEELPDWMGSLTNLVELDISWSYLHCKQLFSVLCKLPNLERLTLGSYFIRKNQDMVACNSQSFPELKELTLGYSPEVPPSYIFEEGSMPKLETLVLNFGDQGKTIVGIEHLTNLREVQIDNCIQGSLADALNIFKVENKKRHDSKREQIRVIVR
ncbi:hypothetical protein ACQJBY_042066 [Aegilops geniculata]